MAFKTSNPSQSVAANPAAHFKTLTKRQYPDVMPHQKEMLENYAVDYTQSKNLALQLPTGSGKTLVGLLIADWRRRKYGERAVFLCPTRQLVHQSVQQAHQQYGIDVVDLSGAKAQFAPEDKAAFTTGEKIAVSTYSAFFNTHPFFEDPDLVIIDDAHAAENYIANMWSLHIDAGSTLHTALAEFLKSYITVQEHARLTGNWRGSSDATWVDKIPTPLFNEISDELVCIIDAHVNRDVPELYFPWSLIRDNLDGCHTYLSSTEILIRPLIPPTFTHAPFANAKQRIFMSATLGRGGDLERLTGCSPIQRMAAPEGFQMAGVGRRFFIFPTLSLTSTETEDLRLAMHSRAGRSVTLTPNNTKASEHVANINANLSGFSVFNKDDIEEDKSAFISTQNAVAVLANRYDGIDFPNEECRFLSVDGLPRAMNSQERFIMSKMGAVSLYNERIQSRVLQAIGRCTRALQDRSAVFITGTELVDFLADNRKWHFLPPELHAELKFGVFQSKGVTAQDILENFEMFLRNDADWASADHSIRMDIQNCECADFPSMDELEQVVSDEIKYQNAMWQQNFDVALEAGRSILAKLNHRDLRGYRALWHYLTGIAAWKLSAEPNDAQSMAAIEQFKGAQSAAPSITWLNSLSRTIGQTNDAVSNNGNVEISYQVERLEKQFLKMGTVTNHKFEKKAADILNNLSATNTFEMGQVQLGELLGFNSGNEESDASPDPWWLGQNIGVVFEDHADGQSSTVFGANKARQAASHPNWIYENVPEAENLQIHPILVTPCTQLGEGAVPHVRELKYWLLEDFKSWASHAISTLRSLKGSFPGEGDLVWRAQAAQVLEESRMTISTIIEDRQYVLDRMSVK